MKGKWRAEMFPDYIWLGQDNVDWSWELQQV